TMSLAGTTVASGTGEIRLDGAGSIQNNGSFTARPGVVILGVECCTAPARFVNNGTFTVAPVSGSATGVVTVNSAIFEQRNVVDVSGGQLDLTIAPSHLFGGSRVTGAGKVRLINTFDTASISGAVTL